MRIETYTHDLSACAQQLLGVQTQTAAQFSAQADGSQSQRSFSSWRLRPKANELMLYDTTASTCIMKDVQENHLSCSSLAVNS